MPALANTQISSTLVHMKEDLRDIIEQLSPEETPFYTACSKVIANNIKYDWVTDSLASVDRANRQPEGNQFAAQPITPPTRLDNYCQISDKRITVSGTTQSVDVTGGVKEYDRQLLKKGMELRRDVEAIALNNQAKAATDPRAAGGFLNYVSTVSLGATGVAAAANGTATHTPGTLRALTLPLIDTVMQISYTKGGRPDKLFMPPSMAIKFKGLKGITDLVSNTGIASKERIVIQGAVSAYVTPFGTLDVMVDQFMLDNMLALIDFDYVEMANLEGRAFAEVPIAKSGDADSVLLLFEGGSKVTAPDGHALILAVDPAL